MGVLTKEVAERIPDEHLRSAALEGADLNHICSSCYGNDTKRDVCHDKCTGEYEVERGVSGSCCCNCSRARALRVNVAVEKVVAELRGES
jgi:hypothetical protein